MILYPWAIFIMKSYLRSSYGVDKKVSYISETFNGERKKGYGILSIGYQAKTVTFESFKGPDPEIQDLLFFLFSDKDIRKLIREYQHRGRKEDYKIDVWSASATKVYINFYRRGIFTYRKHLFDFTCNLKINKIDRIYILEIWSRLWWNLTANKIHVGFHISRISQGNGYVHVLLFAMKNASIHHI